MYEQRSKITEFIARIPPNEKGAFSLNPRSRDIKQNKLKTANTEEHCNQNDKNKKE